MRRMVAQCLVAAALMLGADRRDAVAGRSCGSGSAQCRPSARQPGADGPVLWIPRLLWSAPVLRRPTLLWSGSPLLRAARLLWRPALLWAGTRLLRAWSALLRSAGLLPLTGRTSHGGIGQHASAVTPASGNCMWRPPTPAVDDDRKVNWLVTPAADSCSDSAQVDDVDTGDNKVPVLEAAPV